MRLLFLFLDGVGLGADDPAINPLALASLPVLCSLLEGGRLTASHVPFEGAQASLVALDTRLGVEGLPQSATGQATLLTGKNVPAALGYHYGPKPDPAIAAFLRNDNLFHLLRQNHYTTGFLNAYPPRYFETIQSGRRLYSAIPLAASSAGLSLRTREDLLAGRALSADFTAQGWRDPLGLNDTPVLSPFSAGELLADLAQSYDFSFFEYWLSDYAGHHQDFKAALNLLATLDQVLAGLLSHWNRQEGLILLTSDHGNLEDLSTRHHTYHPVPALCIGAPALRKALLESLPAPRLHSLADVTPAILRFFNL